MAIFHFHTKIGTRSNGKSAVASSAYRSGEKLKDELYHKTHNYKRKQAIIYTDVLLPEGVPSEYQSREKLWNDIESLERRVDAQLYREFEISLPIEASKEERIQLAKDFASELVNMGMIVDLSIHDVKKGQYKRHGKATNDNPHMHLLCTLRKWEEGKFLPKVQSKFKLDKEGNRIPILDRYGKQKIKKNGGKCWERIDEKTTNWDEKETLLMLRKKWEQMTNDVLKKYGTSIDSRTLEEQLKDIEKEKEVLEAGIISKREARERINERLRRLNDRGTGSSFYGRDRELALSVANSTETSDREDRIDEQIAEREREANRIIERRKQETARLSEEADRNRGGEEDIRSEPTREAKADERPRNDNTISKGSKPKIKKSNPDVR